MPEIKVNTTAGSETASQTVARITAERAAAAKEGGSPSNKTTPAENPLIKLLTERLTQQGQGISSSSSSNLQASIDEAIKGAQTAGDLTNQSIQSQRDREVAFARGQASDTYTAALEGRTGYATQVAGLRSLTETTEKSIRDLDQRYQEASLANDANTMKLISELKMKKLEFQQQQEENFYSNLFSAANLQQTAIGQQLQNDQFWAGQENQQNQFALQMKQSDDQFTKNLGIQYQEIGLKQQSLELERQRNNISAAEYKLKAAEFDKEKDTTSTLGMITTRILNARKKGVDYETVDPLADAGDMYAQILSTNPNFKMDQNEFNTLYMEARTQAMNAEITAPRVIPSNTGGVTLMSLLGLGRSNNSTFPTREQLDNQQTTISAPKGNYRNPNFFGQ